MPVHRPKRPFPLALLLDIGITPDPEGAHAPTPRCSNIAVFRRHRPTEPSARSRSRLRERPMGASESAPEADDHPAPRADPPGASGQRDMPARVRPDVRVRVQGDCRRERAPRCGARQRRRHQALERESPQGAQPTGIPAGAEGTSILARNGRGRCGERPHARNGRSRATRRAARGERGGP